MTDRVTYRERNMTGWNENRRSEIELDALARVYLGDPEITDRDRMTFALRELRKRGYDVEECAVDWTKPLVIRSVDDSKWCSFGEPPLSKLHKRLERIAQRSCLITWQDLDRLLAELYPGTNLFEDNDFLEDPYEFVFKGDPALVEAVFQAVGFATQHCLLVPDDGSETENLISVAPPTMVSS